jgi:VCBS repeat-containing protein
MSSVSKWVQARKYELRVTAGGLGFTVIEHQGKYQFSDSNTSKVVKGLVNAENFLQGMVFMNEAMTNRMRRK